MESVNYTGSYMETELSDSIVLIEELTDPKGVKGDQLGGSGKLYNSCFIHRRNQRDDEDDDAGEAIAIGMPERGTPDGKSDTDIDDEDVTSSGRRGSNVRVTFYGDDHQIDRHDEDDEEDGEDEDEDEDDEDEDETDEDEDERGRQGEGEDEDENDEEDDEEDDEEEEEEEEHIEVRTPQWTENRITTSDTASADSNSTSECESKSTSVSFVDDSLLMTTSQPIDGQENSNGMTLTTDYSDLDDKTDFSSFQELTADNDGTNDELEYDGDTESNQKRSKQMDIRGGPNDNKGFDTVDTQLIVHHRRPQKGSNEETVGLLSGEVADKLHQITEEEDDDPLIELACQPLMYLDNPLMGKGVPDDQVSLLTKHSVYQRNSMKLSVGTSTSCSASASSASTSSTSSRTIARRMVKSSGKAVKSFSRKFTKLFK